MIKDLIFQITITPVKVVVYFCYIVYKFCSLVGTEEFCIESMIIMVIEVLYPICVSSVYPTIGEESRREKSLNSDR